MFLRSAIIFLIVTADDKIDTENQSAGVAIGIKAPSGPITDDSPSLKYQNQISESMKQMAESLNRVSKDAQANKSASVSDAMSDTLAVSDKIKEDREDAKDLEEAASHKARREGAQQADETVDALGYSAEQHLDMQNMAGTRVQEKMGDARRRKSLGILDADLNSMDDVDESFEDKDEIDANDDVEEDDKEIEASVDDLDKNVEDTLKKAKKEEGNLSKRSRAKIREMNAEHIMQMDDCPPGYVPRSQATAAQLKNQVRGTPQEPEPCPVALADAPCPCVMESFEPLQLDATQKTEKGEDQQDHSAKQDENETTAEEDEAGGTENCEDFLNRVEDEFGDKMEDISIDALEPLKKNLKRGTKVGVRTVKS